MQKSMKMTGMKEDIVTHNSLETGGGAHPSGQQGKSQGWSGGRANKGEMWGHRTHGNFNSFHKREWDWQRKQV